MVPRIESVTRGNKNVSTHNIILEQTKWKEKNKFLNFFLGFWEEIILHVFFVFGWRYFKFYTWKRVENFGYPIHRSDVLFRRKEKREEEK